MHTLFNRGSKHLVLAGLVMSMAGGCTEMADEPVGETAQEARVEKLIWTDGSPDNKTEPGDEDEIARYYPDENIVEIVTGFDQEAIESLELEGVLRQGYQIVYIPNWWWWVSGQLICQNEYYSVYKNSTCGWNYSGYSFINNDYYSGNSTVGTRADFKTCRYCPGCGYCVARRNVVIGNYTVYDQLNGNGLPISTGDFYAKEACYVGPF